MTLSDRLHAALSFVNDVARYRKAGHTEDDARQVAIHYARKKKGFASNQMSLWKEEDHDRDEGGKFASKGTGTAPKPKDEAKPKSGPKDEPSTNPRQPAPAGFRGIGAALDHAERLAEQGRPLPDRQVFDAIGGKPASDPQWQSIEDAHTRAKPQEAPDAEPEAQVTRIPSEGDSEESSGEASQAEAPTERADEAKALLNVPGAKWEVFNESTGEVISRHKTKVEAGQVVMDGSGYLLSRKIPPKKRGMRTKPRTPTAKEKREGDWQFKGMTGLDEKGRNWTIQVDSKTGFTGRAQRDHLDKIRRAIARGEEIPDNVLSDYKRELAKVSAFDPKLELREELMRLAPDLPEKTVAMLSTKALKDTIKAFTDKAAENDAESIGSGQPDDSPQPNQDADAGTLEPSAEDATGEDREGSEGSEGATPQTGIHHPALRGRFDRAGHKWRSKHHGVFVSFDDEPGAVMKSLLRERGFRYNGKKGHWYSATDEGRELHDAMTAQASGGKSDVVEPEQAKPASDDEGSTRSGRAGVAPTPRATVPDDWKPIKTGGNTKWTRYRSPSGNVTLTDTRKPGPGRYVVRSNTEGTDLYDNHPMRQGGWVESHNASNLAEALQVALKDEETLIRLRAEQEAAKLTEKAEEPAPEPKKPKNQPQPAAAPLSFAADDKRPSKEQREEAAEAIRDLAREATAQYEQWDEQFNVAYMTEYKSPRPYGDSTHWAGRVLGYRAPGETSHPTPTRADLHKAWTKAKENIDYSRESWLKKLVERDAQRAGAETDPIDDEIPESETVAHMTEETETSEALNAGDEDAQPITGPLAGAIEDARRWTPPKPKRGGKYSKKELAEIGGMIRNNPMTRAAHLEISLLHDRAKKWLEEEPGSPIAGSTRSAGNHWAGHVLGLHASAFTGGEHWATHELDPNKEYGDYAMRDPEKRTPETVAEIWQKHIVPQLEKTNDFVKRMNDPKWFNRYGGADPQEIVDEFGGEWNDTAERFCKHIHDIEWPNHQERNYNDWRKGGRDDTSPIPALDDVLSGKAELSDVIYGRAQDNNSYYKRSQQAEKKRQERRATIGEAIERIRAKGTKVDHLPTLTRSLRKELAGKNVRVTLRNSSMGGQPTIEAILEDDAQDGAQYGQSFRYEVSAKHGDHGDTDPADAALHGLLDKFVGAVKGDPENSSVYYKNNVGPTGPEEHDPGKGTQDTVRHALQDLGRLDDLPDNWRSKDSLEAQHDALGVLAGSERTWAKAATRLLSEHLANKPRPSAVQQTTSRKKTTGGGAQVAVAQSGSQPAPADHPRGEAQRKRAELDSDYAWARKSEVRNRGGDTVEVARHRANAWRSLAEAEEGGNGAKFASRSHLEKAQPHSLDAGAGGGTKALLALSLHYALKKFPTNSEYKRKRWQKDFTDEEKKQNRKDYVESYERLQTAAHEIAEKHDEPGKAIRDMQQAVRDEINRLRGVDGGGRDSISQSSARDPNNATANALVKMYDGMKWYGRSKTSVKGQMETFSREMSQKYGGFSKETTPIETIQKHAQDIISGQSIAKSFEKAKEDKPQRFNPSKAYVEHAKRTGGRENGRHAEEALDHLEDKHGIASVTFGNTMNDDERRHHSMKTAEAFLDLADTLGIDDGDISLGGKLKMQFGANGRGNTRAHYMLGTNAINLNRASGAGSLAHEWAHAFDHHVTGTNDLASDHRAPPELKEAYGDWHTALVPYRERVREKLQNLVNSGLMSAGFANRWLSREECFARTVERHVQDELHGQGRENTYLTGLSKKASEGLWPNEEETAAMAPAIKKIISTWKDTRKPVKNHKFRREYHRLRSAGHSIRYSRLNALKGTTHDERRNSAGAVTSA